MIAGVMFPMNNLAENKKHYLLLQKWHCKHIFYADFIIRYYESEITWWFCSSQTILGSADTQKNLVSPIFIPFNQEAYKLGTEKSYTGLSCPSTHLPTNTKHAKSCRGQDERKN